MRGQIGTGGRAEDPADRHRNAVERHGRRQFAVADQGRHDRLHRRAADDEAEADQRRADEHRDARRTCPAGPGRRTATPRRIRSRRHTAPCRAGSDAPDCRCRPTCRWWGSGSAAARTARRRPGRPSAPSGSRRTSRSPRRCRASTPRRRRTSCPRTARRRPGRTSARAHRADRGGGGGFCGHPAAARSKRSVSRSSRVTSVSTSRVGPVGDGLGDQVAPPVRHRRRAPCGRHRSAPARTAVDRRRPRTSSAARRRRRRPRCGWRSNARQPCSRRHRGWTRRRRLAGTARPRAAPAASTRWSPGCAPSSSRRRQLGRCRAT